MKGVLAVTIALLFVYGIALIVVGVYDWLHDPRRR